MSRISWVRWVLCFGTMFTGGLGGVSLAQTSRPIAEKTEHPKVTRVEISPDVSPNGRTITVVRFPGGVVDPSEEPLTSLPVLTHGVVSFTVYHDKKYHDKELGNSVWVVLLRDSGEVWSGWMGEKGDKLSIKPSQHYFPSQAPNSPLLTLTSLSQVWDFLGKIAGPKALEVSFDAEGTPLRATLVGVKYQPFHGRTINVFRALQYPRARRYPDSNRAPTSAIFYERGPDAIRGVLYGRDGECLICTWNLEGELIMAQAPWGDQIHDVLLHHTSGLTAQEASLTEGPSMSLEGLGDYSPESDSLVLGLFSFCGVVTVFWWFFTVRPLRELRALGLLGRIAFHTVR